MNMKNYLLIIVITSFVILVCAMTTPINVYYGIDVQKKLWLKYPTMFENPFRFK